MEQPTKQTNNAGGRIAVAVVLTILFFVAIFRLTTDSPTDSTAESNEPAYMGYTRQSYLAEVSNNGRDRGMYCAYSYLIDNYGLEATFKMDMRADRDGNDIDPAIYEAMDNC